MHQTRNFASFFTELADRLDVDEMQMVGVVARLIWLQRNSVVFGEDFTSPKHILETASSQLENFRKADAGRSMGTTIRYVPEVVKGSKPSLGWIKLNWDVAVDSRMQKMGIGIIAQDHTGLVLAVICDRCQILFIRPPLLMFVRLLAALITNILYSF
jgi:hypothetical protein